MTVSKQWLLWVNTILTGVAAFIGQRLWDKIDHLNNDQIRYEERVDNMLKTQEHISKEHHEIFQRLDRLDKKIP